MNNDPNNIGVPHSFSRGVEVGSLAFLVLCISRAYMNLYGLVLVFF